MTKFQSFSRGNETHTYELWFFDPFQTVNSTPVLITSFPLAINKTIEINVHQAAIKNDETTRNVGNIKGVFHRIAGDILQDGTLDLSLRGVLSPAKVGFTINNTTKEVEIWANGTNSTINWKGEIEVRMY